MLFWLLVFVIVIACICSSRKKRERELARLDQLIAVCREDIAILPFFRASWNCYEEESHREAYGDGTDSKPEFADRIDYWESYRRLAMIYEKRKDYQQAINVCREALANGITKDGSKGGFVGRAARMAKKLLDQKKSEN